MNITIPPSETDKNIEAIKHAIDNKIKECDQARDKLTELCAELRGLQAALKVISPGSLVQW